jgi:hypothetical protein
MVRTVFSLDKTSAGASATGVKMQACHANWQRNALKLHNFQKICSFTHKVILKACG